jgi:hypothetical protein
MMLGNNNMMMQAFGAMMRGESPGDFLKNLANTNPQSQYLLSQLGTFVPTAGV